MSEGIPASVEVELSAIQKQVSENAAQLSQISQNVDAVRKDLAKLSEDFQKLVVEQRKKAALQQATTELITLRQEFEKNYGSYRVVRNTMVGILQATDSALVRKTTISKVSEELMISTPRYWLAPVVVALAAWIGNDRDLANRAIREAVKRDNEHTSLTMALICRRNQRTNTCYEWLSRYFATQNAADFDEDSLVYIDAYINGVFGPDEKHLCDDYVDHWMEQVRSRQEDFESSETEKWSKYLKNFNVDEGSFYPELKSLSPDFERIEGYLGRIDAVDAIRQHFANIAAYSVDQEKLARSVDDHLMALVASADPEERAARKKEELYVEIRNCGGDVTLASAHVKLAEQAEKLKRMNLVDQLARTIRKDEGGEMISQKKMAISLLRKYINRGFDKYIHENKENFPEQVAIILDNDGWKGTVSDGNGNELKSSYGAYVEAKKNKTVHHQTPAVILGIIGLVLLPVFLPFGVILLLAAAYLFLKTRSANAESVRKFDEMKQTGCQQIDKCVSEWQAAKEKSSRFQLPATFEVA